MVHHPFLQGKFLNNFYTFYKTEFSFSNRVFRAIINESFHIVTTRRNSDCLHHVNLKCRHSRAPLPLFWCRIFWARKKERSSTYKFVISNTSRNWCWKRDCCQRSKESNRSTLLSTLTTNVGDPWKYICNEQRDKLSRFRHYHLSVYTRTSNSTYRCKEMLAINTNLFSLVPYSERVDVYLTFRLGQCTPRKSWVFI